MPNFQAYVGKLTQEECEQLLAEIISALPLENLGRVLRERLDVDDRAEIAAVLED